MGRNLVSDLWITDTEDAFASQTGSMSWILMTTASLLVKRTKLTASKFFSVKSLQLSQAFLLIYLRHVVCFEEAEMFWFQATHFKVCLLLQWCESRAPACCEVNVFCYAVTTNNTLFYLKHTVHIRSRNCYHVMMDPSQNPKMPATIKRMIIIPKSSEMLRTAIVAVTCPNHGSQMHIKTWIISRLRSMALPGHIQATAQATTYFSTFIALLIN